VDSKTVFMSDVPLFTLCRTGFNMIPVVWNML